MDQEMKLKKFGSNEIFRPRGATEQQILNEEAGYVLARHKPGKFTNRDEINTVLQTICSFHRSKLDEVLPRLATRSYISFLLWQYDQSHEALLAGRKGDLNDQDAAEWLLNAPIIRRSFKYLIEAVCSLQLAAKQIEDDEELLLTTEVAQVCAEEFVRLSMLSDSTFAIFPLETELALRSEKELFELKVTNEKFRNFGARHEVDGKNRQRFLADSAAFTLDRDTQGQDKYLGDSFERAHGVRYSKAIEILASLVTFEAVGNQNEFESCYFHKTELIPAFAEAFSLTPEVVEKIFSGFCIKPDDIEKSSESWNPKRSYGANRKALFEVPHVEGSCFAWSRHMAHEALEALVQASVFHKFPIEWMHPDIKSALDKLDNNRGSWFESVVIRNLSNLGFVGRSRKDTIGTLAIPKDVGEIDYLGYSIDEHRLVIIECKMTQYSAEAKMWRDDLHKYVTSEKNYAMKLRKKRDWIIENLKPICNTISIEQGMKVQPKLVSTAMITYSPNIASCFIDDFECVSIAELMVAANDEKKWPYNLGTLVLEPTINESKSNTTSSSEPAPALTTPGSIVAANTKAHEDNSSSCLGDAS